MLTVPSRIRRHADTHDFRDQPLEAVHYMRKVREVISHADVQ